MPDPFEPRTSTIRPGSSATSTSRSTQGPPQRYRLPAPRRPTTASSTMGRGCQSGGKRRGRDSNPRTSLPPVTRLAGECLQPLGHLSGNGPVSVEPPPVGSRTRHMLPWSAHISMLYAEHPYPERPGLARAAGFDWVESHWPATAEDRDALASAATDHGLRVALVNTDGGDMAAGERGQLLRSRARGARTARFLDGRRPGRARRRAQPARPRRRVPGRPGGARRVGAGGGDAARARARGDRRAASRS